MSNKKVEVNKTNAAWDKAEVPIIIGVSAHRRINFNYAKDLEEKLKARVREVLTAVREKCPNSPIYMLNGLALGGDQLCADVAVEMGIKLIVAMPFERSEYVNERDFPGDSYEKFDGYFENGHVLESFVVPDMEQADEEKGRDYLFRQQGIYVATNCHILLALWDGKLVVDKRLECGTGAAIGFALKHSYYQPNGMEFSPSDDGAVAWVFTPCVDGSYGERSDCELKYLVPTEVMDEVKNSDGDTAGSESDFYVASPDLPQKLVDILLHTDRYNRDYYEYCCELKKKEKRRDGEYLLDETEYDSAPRKAKAILHCHNMASRLSSLNKKKNMRALMALAVMGMAMLLSFMVYDQLAYMWTVALCIVMLVVLVFTFVLMYAGEKAGGGRIKFDVHSRFIEYRALSEALRVQYYMTMYGIEESVCRYFTWSHKSLMPWVRKAVIALNVGKTVAAWENAQNKYEVYDNTQIMINSGRTDARGIFENKLFNKWIGHDKHDMDDNNNGQLGYHLNSIDRKRTAIRKRDVIRRIALIVTLFAYVTLFVCELLPFDLGTAIVGVLTWRMLLKCTLSTLVAVTFLISYYYGKQSLDLIQSDSVNMVRLYRTALDRANKIYDSFKKESDCDNAIRSLICELAREQLIENVTWVAYNKDNDIEMPI